MNKVRAILGISISLSSLLTAARANGRDGYREVTLAGLTNGTALLCVTGEFSKGVPAYSAASDQSNAKRRKVGEFLDGGVIFHVDDSGLHGLICSVLDIGGEGQRWSNVWRKEQAGFNGIAELAKSETDGRANTMLIVKRGHNDVARLCRDYRSTDQGKKVPGDWYLPSIEELKLLHRAKAQVNQALDADGNAATTRLQEGYYWSSTETNAGAALAYTFFLGDISRPHKSYYYWVRAIRAF